MSINSNNIVYSGAFTTGANDATGLLLLAPYTRFTVCVRYSLTGTGSSFTLYGSGFDDDPDGGVQIGEFTYSPGEDESGEIKWTVDDGGPYIDLRFVNGSVEAGGTVEVLIVRH